MKTKIEKETKIVKGWANFIILHERSGIQQIILALY